MSEHLEPQRHQMRDWQATAQRRRAAFVLVLGAAIFAVTSLVLWYLGRQDTTDWFWAVIATFALAEGIQLIAEWRRPEWFQPHGEAGARPSA